MREEVDDEVAHADSPAFLSTRLPMRALAFAERGAAEIFATWSP
ncbi:hypothetical protein [Streptomyces sp. fd1-xmd]|nr:hypothetical protein [Streptomyces sp. fd1-xmd]